MDMKLGSLIIMAVAIIGPISGAEDPQCTCPRQSAPVCGSDGSLYPNECLLECTKTILQSDLRVTKKGPCNPVTPQCTCVKNLAPVCGTDGITYNNICLLRCARQKNQNLEVQGQGTCDGLKRSKRNAPYELRYRLHRRQPCSFE